MTVYFDSSVIVAAYLPESNSPTAREWIQRPGFPFPFTPFHALEVRNGIHLRQFRREISLAESAEVLAALEADLTAGVWATTALPIAETLRVAQRLSALHTPSTGCRSLDLLHVASALTFAAKTFLTFDIRQRAVAQAEGLRVKP